MLRYFIITLVYRLPNGARREVIVERKKLTPQLLHPHAEHWPEQEHEEHEQGPMAILSFLCLHFVFLLRFSAPELSLLSKRKNGALSFWNENKKGEFRVRGEWSKALCNLVTVYGLQAIGRRKREKRKSRKMGES